MNKFNFVSLVLFSILLIGCNKNTNNDKALEGSSVQVELEDFSCTAQSNVEEIEKQLILNYEKELERMLRNSSYDADGSILEKLKKGINFKLSAITTVKSKSDNQNILECSSQVSVSFPKGLQKRAENAYESMPCEDEYCGRYVEDGSSLQDFIDGYNLTLANDKLQGAIEYSVTKTDKDGLQLGMPNDSSVISVVAKISKIASQYESYIKENNEQIKELKKSEQSHLEQANLAQKSMDLRRIELDKEKARVVERLNTVWDSLSDEDRVSKKQEQATWFEKRDVDCKVLSQQTLYDLKESEKEVYQQHSEYWNDAMRKQNTQMLYNKCFINRTLERIDYLS